MCTDRNRSTKEEAQHGSTYTYTTYAVYHTRKHTQAAIGRHTPHTVHTLIHSRYLISEISVHPRSAYRTLGAGVSQHVLHPAAVRGAVGQGARGGTWHPLFTKRPPPAKVARGAWHCAAKGRRSAQALCRTRAKVARECSTRKEHISRCGCRGRKRALLPRSCLPSIHAS